MSNSEQAPVESYVDLPAEVDFDFDVYLNGVLQEYEVDYRLDGRALVFPRNLAPETGMTKFQLLRALFGIAGTYNKHDSIDITYERDGHRSVITGLKPRRASDE
jgi:hypothetical protein